MIRKILAFLVHLYTASGGVLALLSVIAISNSQWSLAMTWLMLCFFIDGSDGMLARKVKVSEVLPKIKGKEIDYVIDFLTYAFIPAYFTYASDLVPPTVRLVTASYIVVISAFYYGKQGMISEKNQFSGFPVLWNLVVFYEFFVFGLNSWLNFILIIFFGILHFIPIEISYPSKNLKKHKAPVIIGFLMLALLIGILYYYPEKNIFLQTGAWLGLLYFTYLTLRLTWFYQKE